MATKGGIIIACGDLMSKVLKVNIRGILYSVKIISEKSFDSQYGKNTLAVTIPFSSLMVFRPSSVDLGIIRHEVTHAYLSGSLADTVKDLTLYDYEELFCECFRVFGPQMLKDSATIYRLLRKELLKKWK